jgi:hypothetical protein
MSITQTQYYANAREIHAFWLSEKQTPIFAAAMLAQADAESSLSPNAIGDNGSAWGLYQLHMDRIVLIRDGDAERKLPGCGIDVSKLPPLVKQLEAVWFELQHSESHALKMIQAAATSYDAGYAACKFYERAGAPGQNVKRGNRAVFWASYFMQKAGVA